MGRVHPDSIKTITDAINSLKACLSNDGGNSDVLLQAILDAIQQLEVTVQSQQRQDWEQTAYCEDGVITGYVIKVRDEQTGVFTTEYWDDQQNPTPTPPTGTPCLSQDVEYESEVVELCAINDGTGYSAGDKIRWQFVTELGNPTSPYVIVVKNLSDGTYPNALYLQINGTDIVGTQPPSGDFGDCSDCIVVCKEKLCLTSSSEPTIGGSTAEFLANITGVVNTEDFATVADGSYSSIVVPSGTYFHYDYSASGLFAGTQRTITSEDPITQNGASLPQRGIETIGGGTTSYNSIIHCLTSPIGFWGADTLDVESNPAFGESRIITYDAALNVLSDDVFSGGENIVQFVGITNPLNNISYVQIVVGDQNGPPLADQLAYTNVVYGVLEDSQDSYTKVTCLQNGQLSDTYYDNSGQEVTDQNIIDQLNPCEVDPISIVDYEYSRVPICDTDNNISLFQQFLTINDELQTPTLFFDAEGNEVPEPANFVLGFCPGTLPPNVEFEDSDICIDGTNPGKRRTYIDTSTQLVVAVEFLDSMGTVIPIPTNWEFGTCSENKSQCVKWSNLIVGLDNTGTTYNASYTFDITLSDGRVLQVQQTPTTGWTAQLNQWVTNFGAALNSLYPTQIVEARCNIAGGCGGLLEPNSDVNFNLMFARYLNITACPTDAVPVKVEITQSSIPLHLGRVLDLEFFRTPERRGYVCYNCGTAPVLYNQDGTQVEAADLPVCYFDCAESYPEIPTTSCNSDFEEQGCDTLNDPDPLNWVSVFRRFVSCDGSDPIIEYYTLDVDGALEDYSLIGEFVDCDSGNPIPEPECKQEIFATHVKYDIYNGVEIDGVVYQQQDCGGGVLKWVHPTEDIAVIDEQTIVGGWAFVVNSAIDPINCSVEAASILSGTPPDPTTLDSIQACLEIQQIKEKNSCTGEETYRFVIEDGNGNLIPYELQGTLQSFCTQEDLTCVDCSDESPANGIVTILPNIAEAKAGSSNPDPATIEAALGTTTDLSGLITGSNTNGPDTGNEDWLTRFDLSNLAPECATINSLTLEIDSEPTDGGFAILIYDGNDPNTEIYSTIVGGDGWTYHQFNGSSNILFGGHDFVPANPNPQPTSGSYTTTTPIDLGTLPSDLSNITVATIVITGSEFTSAVRFVADIDSSGCSEPEEKKSKRVVIDPECQTNLGNIPVEISNETPITVIVQEPTSTELTTSNTICYPDDDSSSIVLEYTQVVQVPANVIIASYYTIIALGSGTISAGLNVGDQFTPPDALLLGQCPPGSEPSIENQERTLCDLDGNEVICRETFDTTAGPIGSGNEVSLFINYYASDGSELPSFDPLTDSGPCKIPCECLDIKEHYLCINNIKTPVWVQLNKEDLTINQVINTLDLTTVDPTIYENGFLDPCGDCTVSLFSTCFYGFDYYEISNISAGDTSSFTVIEDGNTIGTAVEDFLAQDTGTKSSWYTNTIALVNSTGWTMTVVTDVPSSPATIENLKVTWEFNGPEGSTLEIVRDGGDTLTLTVSGGVVTGTYTESGNDICSACFPNCP